MQLNKKIEIISLFCAIVLLFLFVPYKYEREDYQVLELDKLNPTSYIFHIPMDSLFYLLDSRDGKTGIHYPLATLGYTYGTRNQCFLNKKKCYLELPGIRMPSLIYRNRFNGLKSYFVCRLQCDSLAPNRTRVSVQCLYLGVLRGYNYYFWSRRKLPWILSPPSSTIEEYQLLRLIGKLVEEHDMPPVCYPKKLPAKELEALQAIY